jgi:metal-responsive CopG/Arc/MetJ family transcriptional regulator
MMRTTVELSEPVRTRLRELAMRRGVRLSVLVEEALELYLKDEEARGRRAELGRPVIGTLSEAEADSLRASVHTLRERWR